MAVTDNYTRWAHLELLDELLSGAERAERQKIYDELVPTYSDPVDQAYRVFEIVSGEATGLAVSVADQLLAQYEILINAPTYAPLGRVTVGEIRDPRWWAPNWAWSRALLAIDPERSSYTDEVARLADELAPQLLRTGADSLVGFYSFIARRAGVFMRLRARMITPSGHDESRPLATMRLVQERRRLFQAGPSADGHYIPSGRRSPLQAGTVD